MNSPQEHQALMEEGIWKLSLDKGNIDEALESFERHKVTTAVDLILYSSDTLNLQLTHSQALRLIRLIMSRKDSVIWHEICLEFSSESPQLQYSVSQIIDCFPKALVARSFPLSTTYAIHHALQYGIRLQELHLSDCALSDGNVEILSEAIRSPSSQFQKLSLWNVNCVSFQTDVVVDGRHHPLAMALAENTTLQCIELRRSMTANLGVMFELINALIGSTSLEDFSLEESNLASKVRVEGDDIALMVPLTKILMDSQCRISNLDLANCGLGQQRHWLQSLLSGLEHNASIESLDLSENGFDSIDMTMVLDGLKRIRGIRQLDLNDQGNLLTHGSIDWLANSCLLNPQPTICLEELQIDNYLPADMGDSDYASENGDEDDGQKRENELVLLKLLRNNPSLGKLGIELDELQERLSPRVVQLLDLNLCGRRLLVPISIQQGSCDNNTTTFQYDQIPLGLWPIILERADSIFSEFPERCANVLHHFSQNGPLLLDY
ncbi:unnamed protein product [Cylindrotheca closterium]|uniref:Uncharacterized protein n=1 Tax=Cylindrotheca closterium TaxID=2856 RepID=A0AAD2G7B8_9STRA|nr:unnamed protein product [Cylindrotheca closterium]